MVNSSYYSSPWFITIFTNSLQSMQDDHSLESSRILELWDYFLTVRSAIINMLQAGWKSIFMMALYFLKMHEQDLLQMNFEQILNFVSETPKLMLASNKHSLTPTDNEDLTEVLHSLIKKATKNMSHISYTLDKLEIEFKQSHEAANHQKAK